VNKNGVPLTALSVSMLGGVLALFSSVVAPDTVFVALSAISGFAVVAVWISICASHFVSVAAICSPASRSRAAVSRAVVSAGAGAGFYALRGGLRRPVV
jgi:amino acid permease